MSDPFDLQRFVTAQAPVYREVLNELTRGRKTTHWIWYIFPQIIGLGQSAMSQHFAIGSSAEARAYFAHAVLGPRLIETTALVCSHAPAPIGRILPYPDDLKFHSSMTLFQATTADAHFSKALADFFDGQPDEATLAILAGQ